MVSKSPPHLPLVNFPIREQHFKCADEFRQFAHFLTGKVSQSISRSRRPHTPLPSRFREARTQYLVSPLWGAGRAITGVPIT